MAISINLTGIYPGPLVSLDEGVIVGSRLPDVSRCRGGGVSIGGWMTSPVVVEEIACSLDGGINNSWRRGCSWLR